jgi:hypothetical protein
MKQERSNTTPYINLSLEENTFEIKGNAFSNGANDLFSEIMDWVDSNIPQLENELECVFALHVLNSVTQKSLLCIFQKLDVFLKQGKKLKVVWYCDPNDEDLIDLADDIQRFYSIPIEVRLKAYRLEN